LKTKITLIEEANIIDPTAPDLPEEVRKSIDAPWVRRRVWLGNEAGTRFGYAVSWWNATVYKEMMPDPTKPIGGSLALAKAEVHREIFAVYKGSNADVLRAFVGASDSSSESVDLWARHYNMWKNGKPFAMICEVFSPTLQKYMGSYSAPPVSAILRTHCQ
jgi:chorismate--pyruvate lyase